MHQRPKSYEGSGGKCDGPMCQKTANRIDMCHDHKSIISLSPPILKQSQPSGADSNSTGIAQGECVVAAGEG